LGAPETAEWNPSELSQNFIDSFERLFGEFKWDEVSFIDQHGNIIGASPMKVWNLKITDTELIFSDIRGNEIERKPFDGKSVDFGAAGIPVNEIISSFEGNNADNLLNQTWLNARRLILKAEYPTIHMDLKANLEYPALNQVVGLLRGQPKGSTFFDDVWQGSQRGIEEEQGTRLDYALKTFEEQAGEFGAKYVPKDTPAEALSAELAKHSLPKDLQELIVLGICGIESTFSDSAASDAGALGAWQFMQATGKEHGLKIETVKIKKGGRKVRGNEDERRDFVKATKAAVSYFTKIYNDFLRSKDFQEVAKRFNLAPEDFLYPCVLNAYHAGPARMKGAISWFIEQYSVERIEQ